jgi:hypothetical protein
VKRETARAARPSQAKATGFFCELITLCLEASFKDVLLVVGMDIPADCEFKRTLK